MQPSSPLGIAQVLDIAVKLWTQHALALAKTVLVVLVPVQVLSAVVLAATVSDPEFFDITSSDRGEDDAVFFGQLGVAALSSFGLLLATGACFHAIAEAWLGRQPDWRASLRFALDRAGPLVWVSVLYAIGVALGLVAFLVPGIWLAVAWTVALPALLVEDARGTSALRRSFELVQGRWWATFGAVIIGFLLAAFVSFLATVVTGLLSLASDSIPVLAALSALGGLAASIVTTPFQAAIVAVIYFDLRARREQLDRDRLAQRLEGGEPVPAGAPRPAAPAWQPATPAWQPPPPGRAPPGWLPPSPDPDPPEPARPAGDEPSTPWLPPRPD